LPKRTAVGGLTIWCLRWGGGILTASYPADPIAAGQARRWFETSDPAAYVGSRHHTGPAFCMWRFGVDDKRLLVWRRSTGKVKPCSFDDLSVTNFYTLVSTDSQFYGRMEQLPGWSKLMRPRSSSCC
jgi:hypothetical protein